MIEFEIVVASRLGPRLADAFDGVEVAPGERTTTLRGTGPDRARLHGILAHLQDLGIDIVSLRSRDTDDPADVGAAGGAMTP